LITSPTEIRRRLDPHILPYVEKPGRYVGGEINSVRKDPADVEVSLALLFPDVYEVGMSHIGYQVLYAIVNELDWAAAERAYAPWPDMQARLRQNDIPLYTLESTRPVREFDIVGFSLQYEMLYTNVLAMLDLAAIPLAAAERGPRDPIIVAGGPGAASPEPMADFIDLFVVGDGEETLVELAATVRRMKAAGAGRPEIIIEAARTLRGVYAPALYEPCYKPDGALDSIRPTEPGLPDRILAAKVRNLDLAHFPTEPIVPFIEPVHDRVPLEIMRGCTRGCRFCQAGMLRRPVRPRSVGTLLELAQKACASTGHDEIALASLSSSDHPDFRELLRCLNAFAEPRNVNLSVPSLRVNDRLSLLPEQLARVRKSGLTIAPEAGTDRLRHVINKAVTNDDLLDGVRAAFAAGWRQVKLYFMIGLPTETDEDRTAIADLSRQVSLARREVGGGPAKVNVSVATFVPRPHTPFQWEPMTPQDEIAAARRLILDKGRGRGIRYSFHRAETSLIEAAVCRGDRRLGRVIRRAYESGQQFDAWAEHFRFERWRRAFEAEGLSVESCATRARALDEALPWDHIDFGLSRDFLLEERDRASRGELTPDCRTGPCQLCGVCTAPGSQQPR